MARTTGSVLMDTVTTTAADHRVTWSQIGRNRLARLTPRDIVHDDKNGMLWFRIGAGRPYRKIIIALRADDLYAVEIGRMVKVNGLPEFVSDATEGADDHLGGGLYADQLGEAIDRLVATVTG